MHKANQRWCLVAQTFSKPYPNIIAVVHCTRLAVMPPGQNKRMDVLFHGDDRLGRQANGSCDRDEHDEAWRHGGLGKSCQTIKHRDDYAVEPQAKISCAQPASLNDFLGNKSPLAGQSIAPDECLPANFTSTAG